MQLSDSWVCTGHTNEVRLLQNLSPDVYMTNLRSLRRCAAWLCLLFVLQVLLVPLHGAAEAQPGISCLWEGMPEPSQKPG